mmetsp:Transcript_113123/g.196434  ORF Transcript_113123/g.196434 Transcript_113123/m.196434 type:complete len:365 (+) Transcript_113123:585-1679(+)
MFGLNVQNSLNSFSSVVSVSASGLGSRRGFGLTNSCSRRSFTTLVAVISCGSLCCSSCLKTGRCLLIVGRNVQCSISLAAFSWRMPSSFFFTFLSRSSMAWYRGIFFPLGSGSSSCWCCSSSRRECGLMDGAKVYSSDPVSLTAFDEWPVGVVYSLWMVRLWRKQPFRGRAPDWPLEDASLGLGRGSPGGGMLAATRPWDGLRRLGRPSTSSPLSGYVRDCGGKGSWERGEPAMVARFRAAVTAFTVCKASWFSHSMGLGLGSSHASSFGDAERESAFELAHEAVWDCVRAPRDAQRGRGGRVRGSSIGPRTRIKSWKCTNGIPSTFMAHHIRSVSFSSSSAPWFAVASRAKNPICRSRWCSCS